MNTESQIIEVNIDDIIPNRFQPRIAFDEKGLQELAASIKEHGIIQPLVLRKLGKKYEIIAGERRYKAATMAGLTKVPAIISNIDDNKSAEVALVENIQRRDLTPIEEARSYKNLLDKGYLTQEDLAKKMGLSQPAIANKLRLLNLDESVQQALLEGKISERHARSLLTLTNKEEQKEWLNKIITERLTVRQLDQQLKQIKDNEDSGNDVPLVNLTPNIEEIKQNAEDINKKENKNIASMLVPEETMTELSNNETLDNQPTITPEVTSEPTSPIVEPTPTKEVMPQEPTTPTDQPSNPKFFNNLEEEPASMGNLDEMKKESAFEIQPPSQDIEIFDMPTNNNSNDNNVDLVSNEPVTPSFVPSTEPPQELNPNNKFFQPIPEEGLGTSIDNITIDEPIETPVNPMDSVNNIEEVQETPKSQTLPDTINEIREFVTSIQNKGVDIKLDEADLEQSYQINLTINKE